MWTTEGMEQSAPLIAEIRSHMGLAINCSV